MHAHTHTHTTSLSSFLFLPYSASQESYDKSRQCIRKQRYQFAYKGQDSRSSIFFQKSCMDVDVCVCMFSCVWLFATPWTVACQIPLSMGFPREEYWSGLPFPTLGDLPDTGIKPMSLVSPALAGGFFTTNTTWEALGGEWIHVYECPFNAHPKLSQQCLLISYTPIQNFFLNPH